MAHEFPSLGGTESACDLIAANEFVFVLTVVNSHCSTLIRDDRQTISQMAKPSAPYSIDKYLCDKSWIVFIEACSGFELVNGWSLLNRCSRMHFCDKQRTMLVQRLWPFNAKSQSGIYR